MITTCAISATARAHWRFFPIRAGALLAIVLAGLVGCGSGRVPGNQERASFPGRTLVPGFDHPEDVEVIAQRGVVLVSSSGAPGQEGFLSIVVLEDLRQGVTTRAKNIHGAEIKRPDPETPSHCGDEPPAALRPHGIATVTLPDGSVRVAVVNHVADSNGRETLQLFDLVKDGRDASLEWRGSIPFDAGVYGNDVAFDSSGTIYVTNARSHPDGLLSKLQLALARFLAVPSGDVRFVAPGECKFEVLEGSNARFATGIAVTPDGTRVFVSEGAGKGVLVLDRKERAVVRRRSIAVAGEPDNMSWDDKRLLVAVHTDEWAFIGCASDEKKPDRTRCASPWAVIAFDPDLVDAQPRCVVCGDGADLGAVTSGSVWGTALVLGSAFGTSIAVQQLPKDRSLSRCPCEWNGVAPVALPTPCPSPDRKRDWSRATAPPAEPTHPSAAPTTPADRR